MPRSESHQRAIDQVAILYPHLTPAERVDWYDRLACSLAELTVHMESPSDRLARLLAESRVNGEVGDG